MMSEIISRPLPIRVRLRRGAEPRKVRIAIHSSVDNPPGPAPRRVLDAFSAGLRERLFGRARASDVSVTESRMPEQGLDATVWTGALSGMSPHDLCPVVHMVKASVPSACGLEIIEQHPDERTLLVRAIAPDPEATLLDVDWQISFDPRSPPGVTIRFSWPPTGPIVARARGLVRAWAELVRLGAYPSPCGRAGRAGLTEVEVRDQVCLFAGFDQIRCGHSAFESLFAALDDLHDEAPIVRLEVGCGVAIEGAHASGIAA